MTTVEKGRTSSRSALVTLVACAAVLLAVPLVWWLTRGETSVGERPTPSPIDGGAAARPSDPPSAGAPEPQPSPASPPAPVAPAAPVEPVALRVASLGVDAPVVPSGVAADGSAEVPEDVDTIGWYRFGPAPGSEVGSAVLVGHVDSATQGVGALAGLRSAEVGAEIVVARADGTSVTYQVVAREQVDKQALPVDELFARDGPPRLTIITCGGDFRPSLSSYTDNVVVTAVPVGPAA